MGAVARRAPAGRSPCMVSSRPYKCAMTPLLGACRRARSIRRRPVWRSPVRRDVLVARRSWSRCDIPAAPPPLLPEEGGSAGVGQCAPGGMRARKPPKREQIAEQASEKTGGREHDQVPAGGQQRQAVASATPFLPVALLRPSTLDIVGTELIEVEALEDDRIAALRLGMLDDIARRAVTGEFQLSRLGPVDHVVLEALDDRGPAAVRAVEG